MFIVGFAGLFAWQVGGFISAKILLQRHRSVLDESPICSDLRHRGLRAGACRLAPSDSSVLLVCRTQAASAELRPGQVCCCQFLSCLRVCRSGPFGSLAGRTAVSVTCIRRALAHIDRHHLLSLLAGLAVGCILRRGPERELALGHAGPRRSRTQQAGLEAVSWPFGGVARGRASFCDATADVSRVPPSRIFGRLPAEPAILRLQDALPFQARYSGLEELLGAQFTGRIGRAGVPRAQFAHVTRSTTGRSQDFVYLPRYQARTIGRRINIT